MAPRANALILALQLAMAAEPPPAKADVSGHCFSPEGGCESMVVAAIMHASTFIDCAVYSFTDTAIENALETAVKSGVKVRLIVDKTESKGKGSLWKKAKAAGIPVLIRSGLHGGVFHDKFLIADGDTVETGSFNWTENAEHHNAENALVIVDVSIAALYEAEFQRLWTDGVTSHGL